MKKLLLMAVVLTLAMSSCESRTERLRRVDPIIDIQLVHPDALTNHILIRKGRISVDKTVVMLYNYKDSSYIDVYMPNVYVKHMNALDTISTINFNN